MLIFLLNITFRHFLYNSSRRGTSNSEPINVYRHPQHQKGVIFVYIKFGRYFDGISNMAVNRNTV